MVCTTAAADLMGGGTVLLPRGLGLGHGVEDGQEFAHSGGESHLGRFAAGLPLGIEGLDDRVLTGGHQQGHVKQQTVALPLDKGIRTYVHSL